jgi:hypothetical protein
VHVAVKDQHGRLCQGTVLSVSDNEVALFAESPPRSDLLEIQPANSSLWVRVKTEHCISVSSGYIIRCAFPSPPTPEILEALYGRRWRS